MRAGLSLLLSVSFAIGIGGFAVGWHLASRPGPDVAVVQGTTSGERPPQPMIGPAASPEPIPLPTVDVPGSDIPDLPRYPQSIRRSYRQQGDGDLVFTYISYQSAADRDAIRTFYRLVFHEQGWIVADVRFARARWTFFVVNRSREAVLEIEPLEALTAVHIEISEPRGTAVRTGSVIGPRASEPNSGRPPQNDEVTNTQHDNAGPSDSSPPMADVDETMTSEAVDSPSSEEAGPAIDPLEISPVPQAIEIRPQTLGQPRSRVETALVDTSPEVVESDAEENMDEGEAADESGEPSQLEDTAGELNVHHEQDH